MDKIILASASPRRKLILEQMGLSFEICPAQGKEETNASAPQEIVEQLAYHKAEEIYDRIDPAMNSVSVIGADTIVVYEGRILGKPKDRRQAAEMIGMLQGRVHEVYTGVAVLRRLIDGRKQEVCFHECTRVHVTLMSEAEISRYVSSGEADDKAGAYGIQGSFGMFIPRIEGDYNNVVGLPAARLYQTLKKEGIL